MRRLAAAAAAGMLAVCLAGCAGGQDAETQPAASQDAEPVEQPSAPQDDEEQELKGGNFFDGSSFTDTGEGVMYIATAGGTSEGGNVPQLAPGSIMEQIEVDTEGMDGTVCTVYIDGAPNCEINAGEMTQNTITLEGDALAPGVHKVELVAMDGDAPTIYKSAEYEVA